MGQVWWAAFVLFGTAFISAMPLGFWPLVLVMISVLTLWYYSHLLPISGILGNLIVAAIGSGIIFLGSLVVNRPLAMLYPAGFLFCYALAKEIVWDAHDAIGDRSLGILTVANQWGDRAAFTLAWALLGSLLISIPIATQFLPMAHPWLFFATALAVLGTLGGALLHFQRNRTERAYRTFIRWERLSMALGVLALLATVPPVHGL
jgi:geranylgeranylglycerol-phosphate geranylgeranyltransferase